MSKYKSDDIYLERVLKACEKIKKYSSELTIEKMQERDLEFDAIAMQFQVLGENSVKVANGLDKIPNSFPETVDWVGIKRLRDVISHGYEGLTERALFDYAKSDIINVEAGIRQILKQRYGK